MDTKFSFSVVKGKSLQGTPTTNEIIALDRQNMMEILNVVGLSFPEDKRLLTLFHPSNRVILAKRNEKLVGYIDYCDDSDNPEDLYLSSIQIAVPFQGGPLFRLLVSHLLLDLRSKQFTSIKTKIQKSNSKMIAIATKMGFKIQENSKGGTFNVSADRTVIESSALIRLFSAY